jgi:ligand-binding sensor domain-containing protein
LLATYHWEAYTNTNSVTDVVITDTKIYAATWGGVAVYDRLNNELNSEDDVRLERTLTIVDGLASNDIRSLTWVETTGDIWAGSATDGITIVKSSGMQVLNTESGLPSNRIRRILAHDSYIYVATDLGISQFYYLPEISFPLLLHQYSQSSTQNGLVSNDVRDLCISPDGILYIATANGVSYVHADSLDIDTAWHNWTGSNSPLSFDPVISISVNADFVVMNTTEKIYRHSVITAVPDWQTWSRDDLLADHVFASRIDLDNTIRFSYGEWQEATMSIVLDSTFYQGYIAPGGAVTNIADDDSPGNSAAPVYRFGSYYNNLITCTWGFGSVIKSGSQYLLLQNNCIGFQTVSEIAVDQNNHPWIVSGYVGDGMTRKGTRGVSKWQEDEWINYTVKNSPLISDNMLGVAVDQNNRKWFACWYSDPDATGWSPGLNVFDDATDAWQWYNSEGVRDWQPEPESWSTVIPGSDHLPSNTIAEVAVDTKGNILVVCNDEGIYAYDKDYQYLHSFTLPASFSTNQQVVSIYDNGSRYFFGTNNSRGLIIWDSPDLPTNSTNHWLYSPVPELNNCIVYGVVTLQDVYGTEQNWIASSQGLIMWDGVHWYKYETDIKARIWVNGAWSQNREEGAIWYYADEERIFGSVRTNPTAIFLDPFNRLWIGSQEHGLSMYDPSTERFTNFYQTNSPLLSNYITSLAYEPISGNLLIGTPEGLNTMRIGYMIKTVPKLETVKAYPNPYYPQRDEYLSIVNLPTQAMPIGENTCRIYDASGALIVELNENILARFDWNGLNKAGKKCSSGIYFFIVTSADGTLQRGKFALIQE